MVGDSGGTAGLGAAAGAPGWDRFAYWPRRAALAMLLALLAALVAAAFTPIEARKSSVSTRGFVENMAGAPAVEKERDEDLALYDRAIERIRAGENYYDFIVAEQRAAQYPVTPGLAVRLPTLAYLNAWTGEAGQAVLSVLLMLATLLAWWRRLREEPGGDTHMRLALAFLALGVSLGTNRYFFVLHELWSGMLMALAFGLHRPGRWGWSLAVAALALAIREHALPFVLLMAAMAFWRRDWKEGAAWSALALVFVGMLAWHLQVIAAQVLPTDKPSAPWMVFRGLTGWFSNVALSSNLRFLPHWIAGPAIVLMLFGWMAWKSPAGLFGTLLFGGYGLMFMIAGRIDNFYWGAMIAPAMFMGLAFAPMGLRSLARSIRAK